MKKRSKNRVNLYLFCGGAVQDIDAPKRLIDLLKVDVALTDCALKRIRV